MNHTVIFSKSILTSYSKIWSALLIFMAVAVESRAQTDSLHLDIEETVFTSRRHTSSVRKVDGITMSVDLDAIQDFPKILGNTDPVSFIRMLPGVQTGSEYDSGIYIQGCDNAHNDFSIFGVPIYGVSHLFGLFSVFNPSHYKGMTFSHSQTSVASANRLGGRILMELPDTIKRRIEGEVNIGMMSAQGTLRLKTGKKSHLHVSARRSYLDVLYKRWLVMDGDPINYAFGDYNLTWYASPSVKDKIWVDFYLGHDKGFLGASEYNVSLGVDWGNLAGAVHWVRQGNGVKYEHKAFFSGLGTYAEVAQDAANLELPSSIASVGYRFKAGWKGFSSGADIIGYKAMPQAPVHQGLYGESSEAELQKGLEADVWLDYSKAFPLGLSLSAGLKASAYLSPESNVHYGLSPMLSISWNGYSWGRLTLSYSRQHQFLFQTGLSNIGLPVNFWFLAGRHARPQSANSLSLNHKVEFFSGALALSTDLYYKSLRGQVEYKGDLFDLFTSKYNLDSHLLAGRGRNYGVNFMLHKQAGRFTGWISYSIGRALRLFDNPDYPEVYPANHERIHDLSAVASYDLGKLNFSGNFVFSSGRPFTAPEAFYISGGTIMTMYGDHNACRMRPYVRLDLSVNYAFIKTEKMENGMNLSVYNVLARNNEVMWKLSVTEGKYAYMPASFFMKVMPSISYYHKF